MRKGEKLMPWTTKEVAFLVDNRSHGATWIAEALERTPQAVKRKAQRLGVSLATGSGLCIECHTYPVCTTNVHASKNRLCEVCYRRELIRRQRYEQELLAVKREYKAVNKQTERLRRQMAEHVSEP